jgi:hypothetical protein
MDLRDRRGCPWRLVKLGEQFAHRTAELAADHVMRDVRRQRCNVVLQA